MSRIDDGGPAFPTDGAAVHPADVAKLREHMGWTHEHARHVLGAHPGMSLRDYFAAQALAGLNASLANAIVWPQGEETERMARSAYEQADAMLAERARVRS